MAEITIQEWQVHIDRLGAGEFRRRLKQRLTKAALDTTARAKINATTRPKVRSGRLRSSIRTFVLDEGKGPSLVLQAGGTSSMVGKPVNYAAAQEYGATIKAKFGSRTPAGVQRGSGPMTTRQINIKPTYFMRRAMDVTAKELRVELGDLWRVVATMRG